MEAVLQSTQIIVNIILILLFLGLVILVLKLLKTVRNISEKFDMFSDNIKDIKPKVELTIDKINSLSDNVNSLVTKINQNAEVITTVVDKVKGAAEEVIEFQQNIQKKIEPPVMDTLNTITAVSIGIKTFFDRLKETKKRKIVNDDESLNKIEDFKESMDEVSKELNEVNARLSDLQK